ncbi:hypothetical protein V6Z90_009153 [Aspergillus fumigatus]
MNPTVLGTDTSRHRLDPPKVQSEIQIRKDTSQDMRDTRLARNSQSIRIRPPDQHHLRPERQRFGDIRTPPPPPRIKQHLQPVSHRIHNLRQHIKRPDGPILLPPPMIRLHNPLNPDLHRPPRIRHALDPLQHYRPVPMRLQEPNLLPRVAPPREDHLRPLRRCDTHILLDLHPMPLPKPPSEHRIRKP